MADLPVLYSFRRCPYAMRARLALAYSQQQVQLREVVLRNKPRAMLDVSPKGTVPVLVLPDGRVIDESFDIMRWALRQNDPQDWLLNSDADLQWDMQGLIQENDFVFKQHLDRYKYFERHPEHTQVYYRDQCMVSLAKLETRLAKYDGYLVLPRMTLADMAIVPFVRQFAHVDRDWFYSSEYPHLQAWVSGFCDSDLFRKVMPKFAPWDEADDPIIF
ncbi:glutathione S-transferase [Aliamphritea spongicola]|uniref:glutathione S-transferase n=1 Tax=Aliamphritea spongicola TaxID=707589 RepID=UPI00196B8EF4|nr:glutathione S-transferase [Aliamphritea spongicola]MBN3561305.1 glutathione S-transferase [Aliamphritea spongicola]